MSKQKLDPRNHPIYQGLIAFGLAIITLIGLILNFLGTIVLYLVFVAIAFFVIAIGIVFGLGYVVYIGIEEFLANRKRRKQHKNDYPPISRLP